LGEKDANRGSKEECPEQGFPVDSKAKTLGRGGFHFARFLFFEGYPSS